MRTIAIAITLLVTVTLPASGAVIRWLDVAGISGTSSYLINDATLGRVQVTTTAPAQAIYAVPADTLGALSWGAFDMIIPHAAKSETFSNRWKLSVISEASGPA